MLRDLMRETNEEGCAERITVQNTVQLKAVLGQIHLDHDDDDDEEDDEVYI